MTRIQSLFLRFVHGRSVQPPSNPTSTKSKPFPLCTRGVLSCLCCQSCSISVRLQVFNDGMMDINAYGPFPNAILFNWATIFTLGFGNLAALDFQVKRSRLEVEKCIRKGWKSPRSRASRGAVETRRVCVILRMSIHRRKTCVITGLSHKALRKVSCGETLCMVSGKVIFDSLLFFKIVPRPDAWLPSHPRWPPWATSSLPG